MHANIVSNMPDPMKAMRCPFCREPASKKENRKGLAKRVKANDPAALCHMGGKCHDEGDYDGAFEYYTKAAELGNVDAHYQLGLMYMEGVGVEEDKERAVYHFEKAAIGGHPQARHDLARYEGRNGNIERAVKHFIISAKLGNELSMKALWAEFRNKNIIKEDLDATLRSHQAAINAMKSSERDAAEVVFRN